MILAASSFSLRLLLAVLGQISPEISAILDAIAFGVGAVGRSLLTGLAPSGSRLRPIKHKWRSVACHECGFRPLCWRRFYRTSWPIRLRFQTRSCIFCVIQKGAASLLRKCPIEQHRASHFQRVVHWLSGLGYEFDRTRGHPGEGPQNEKVCCVL
jgi:hypothetical protein